MKISLNTCKSLPSYDKISFFSNNYLKRRLQLEKNKFISTQEFLNAYSQLPKQIMHRNKMNVRQRQSSSLDDIATTQVTNKTVIDSKHKKETEGKIKKIYILKTTNDTKSYNECDNESSLNDMDNSIDKPIITSNNKFSGQSKPTINTITKKIVLMKKTLNYICPLCVERTKQEVRVKQINKKRNDKYNNYLNKACNTSHINYSYNNNKPKEILSTCPTTPRMPSPKLTFLKKTRLPLIKKPKDKPPLDKNKI